jgi:hypothetical protein
MVTTAVVAVVASALFFLLVTWLASSPDAKNALGDPVFEVGEAADFVDQVPLLFQAPQGGGTRDIYVHHLGGSSGRNWVAFRAYREDRSCPLEWNERTERFREPCTGRTYGADPGPAFPHYRATVDGDGTLIIDFRPSPTTTSSNPA